jgi:hypothetical protein
MLSGIALAFSLPRLGDDTRFRPVGEPLPEPAGLPGCVRAVCGALFPLATDCCHEGQVSVPVSARRPVQGRLCREDACLSD